MAAGGAPLGNGSEGVRIIHGSSLVGGPAGDTWSPITAGTYRVQISHSALGDPSGHGEVGVFVQETSVAAPTGHAAFSIVAAGIPLGAFVTATATDALGNTSELTPSPTKSPEARLQPKRSNASLFDRPASATSSRQSRRPTATCSRLASATAAWLWRWSVLSR